MRRGLGITLGVLAVVFAAIVAAHVLFPKSFFPDGERETPTAGQPAPKSSLLFRMTESLASHLGLGLDMVTVRGQRMTRDEDIFAILGLDNTRTMIDLDIGTMQRTVESLPWVSTATITRMTPGILDIRVEERRPFALWRHEGRDRLIDETGRVLALAQPAAGNTGTYKELPRVTGVGAPEEATAFLRLVAHYPAVAERFVAAERVAGRRWTLRLKRDVSVLLPADAEAAALTDLARRHTEDGLLAKSAHILDFRAIGKPTLRPNSDLETVPASVAVSRLDPANR